MTGESGFLPNGTVMEEVEDTTPDKATIPNESTSPDKATVSKASMLPNRLDSSSKTGDNSNINRWVFLSFIFLSSAMLVLFTNYQKRKM